MESAALTREQSAQRGYTDRWVSNTAILLILIPIAIAIVAREIVLRRAIRRANDALAQTREELAQKAKLAAVGELVSGVAHELNNPLQGVLGYAELMSQSQTAGSESEELRAIRANAAKAAGIVRNLLSFAGHDTATRSWHQLNGVVEQAAKKRAGPLQLAEIDLHLRLADRLPLVYVDSNRFEHLIGYLIESAQDAIARRRNDATGRATQKGRHEITVSTSRESNPDRIAIAIAHDGAPVKAEEVTELTTMAADDKAALDGEAVGLSVCVGIVRDHGGLIRATNRDVGAEFVVELPVTVDTYPSEASSPVDVVKSEAVPVADESPEPAPAAARSSVARKTKALVVDDEHSNAALVRRALELAGHEVESTTLSRRALVMIERTPYDVVIADVKMPELNGQELYTRACQIRPEMSDRFIFVTGDIDSDDTMSFLERTRCNYFLKPFNLERLTTTVDMLISGRRMDAIG